MHACHGTDQHALVSSSMAIRKQVNKRDQYSATAGGVPAGNGGDPAGNSTRCTPASSSPTTCASPPAWAARLTPPAGCRSSWAPRSSPCRREPSRAPSHLISAPVAAFESHSALARCAEPYTLHQSMAMSRHKGPLLSCLFPIHRFGPGSRMFCTISRPCQP